MRIFECKSCDFTFPAEGYDNPVFFADKVADCPTCGEKCWEETITITRSEYKSLQKKARQGENR